MGMKNWILIMALAMGALSASAKNVVIDVRTPQEYAGGHIAGAINIDHSVIGQEISKAGVAKDDTVILYCRSGHRAGIAQETLKKMGYQKVENYGGIDEARKRLSAP
jgi:phage shock protein E